MQLKTRISEKLNLNTGYVVVQFYPWFNFIFPLFFSMLIYDNKHQTKENQIEPRTKIELQQIHLLH